MANTFYKSSQENKPYRLSLSRLGAPTSPMVAKQLEEFNKRLNSGIKNIEIGTISADKFEFIPKQHFAEIRKLAELTDAKVSVHGPLIDLAGFPEQGGDRWSEDHTKKVELQLYSILERSFDLTRKKKDGKTDSVPVVFHAGHFQSQEFEKGKTVTVGIDRDTGRPIQEKKEMGFRSIVAVNQDTGQVQKLDYEEKYTPGQKELDIWDPMRRLHNLNANFWKDEKIKIITRLNEVEKLKSRFDEKIKENETILRSGLINNEKWRGIYFSNENEIKLKTDHLQDQNSKIASEYREVYDKFKRFAPPKLLEEQKQQLVAIDKVYETTEKKLDKEREEYHGIGEKLSKMKKDTPEFNEARMAFEKKGRELLSKSIEQNTLVLTEIQKLPSPNMWRFVGDFAKEKTAKTVSNALFKMYSQLKKEGKQDQTPFIALENFFVNAPMSTAKDLREAIIESRKLLANELMKEHKLSESEAKKTAEKLVCATWDVGHINNLRKAGFEGKELQEKVIKETKEIADVTRHVHITDNFGFHDSHLPPGMGNVPIAKIMEELEKKWAEQTASGKIDQEPRAIAEAGGFVAEIGQDPNLAILEFFGSPLYKMADSPYFWGPQGKGITHTYTPYIETFTEFPQQHFNMYGSSFTTLPKSVGGQVGGEASRFSGTPNQ